jgi:IclR family pca regulon transcriptional regulator
LKGNDEPAIVGGLANGLAVIRVFDADHTDMSLSEIARRAGLTRATARRSLLTLIHLGYARTTAAGYTLTARILELGYGYLAGLSITEVAQPHLERLSRLTGESASASVLDGTDVIYVVRVPVRRIMSVSIQIGTRFPAAMTSMGRVLLSAEPADIVQAAIAAVGLVGARALQVRNQIAAVRATGYALVDQELEPGLRSIAAPVRAPEGNMVAAINVATPASDPDPDGLITRVGGDLVDTARHIEADLRAVSRSGRPAGA